MNQTHSAVAGDADNIAALIAAWKVLAGSMPGYALEESQGVTTVFSNERLNFLNVSILDRPLLGVAEFQDAIALARERAKGCRYDSLVALCGAWAPEGWAELVAPAGLRPFMNMTGMATDRMLPALRAPPALDYRLASDVATATDLAVINAHAYGTPVELMDCICNLRLWRENSFGVVGYAEGRPVTCTGAFVIGEMIYIALVATMPDAHGKGYAEAVMRRAIDHAYEAAGRKRLWLHASDMGAPLYHSMGFETGAQLPLFEFA